MVARGQLPVGRADLPARQPAPARAAPARARQAAPARPLGDDPRPELPLRAHEPGDPGARASARSTSPAPATAAPGWSPARTWTAPTARSIRTSGATPKGLRRLFRQFSFPGGIPSHVAPETPGSIHEGGELGYALVHAYGAVLDNPDLVALCVVGDGEAETGPLAASWHSNKFLNPVERRRGAAVLHLNGYKIANPTVLARISHDELRALFEGYGYAPRFVEGSDPEEMHAADGRRRSTRCSTRSPGSRSAPAAGRSTERPRWPMIVLRTPKGWTGPKEVDGLPAEGIVALPSGAARRGAHQPGAPGAARGRGCAPTGPRSCSTSTARCSRRSPRWPRRASCA